MTSTCRWWWVFAVTLVLVSPTLAQEYRGRVQGALTDETQLAVPGAQVTLRNDATGVTVTRTTGPEGRYLFDYVDPGTYTLTAELAASRRSSSATCSFRRAATSPLMSSMKVAALSETVTVDDAADCRFSSIRAPRT